MSFQQLVEHSRRYGSDPAFVLLGGGNTSFKEDRTLYVKASGHALGTIKEDGFVRMDLDLLEQIWHKQYSQDDDQREDEVLKDMMYCRLEGETARPSVEALLHALLPFPYVVHLHPALVNGLTCAQDGEAAVH
ncbi:MAG: class II aldolase, partial [Spirochaetales bacterium]|nr:class II aldolase [Spirochaetales bacterium]